MRGDAVHGFFGADAVIVVLIAVGIRAVCHARKSAPRLPGISITVKA